MKELESNPATKIVWNSIKPMLMGRILYAPDSPAVRQIIRNVSSTHSMVEDVMDVTPHSQSIIFGDILNKQ